MGTISWSFHHDYHKSISVGRKAPGQGQSQRALAGEVGLEALASAFHQLDSGDELTGTSGAGSGGVK